MFDGAMASDIASAPLSTDDLGLAFIDDDEKLADKEKITRNEVVVVDTSITNYRDILTSVGNDADVLTLQRGASLGDIALLISDYNNIDALHVFSHGGAGRLQIGSNFYDRSNIFESKEHLTSIGSKMSETGDILLYGCNLAANREGEYFVDIISEMTCADVAASDDITGNKSLGGDWHLEYHRNPIETDFRAASHFQGTLAAPVLSTGGSSILTGGGGNAFGTDSFSTIVEDNTNSAGDQVSTFLNSDAAGGVAGVAITSVDTSGGSSWQYSLDGGGNWSNFATVNSTNSLLLDG